MYVFYHGLCKRRFYNVVIKDFFLYPLIIAVQVAHDNIFRILHM